MSCLSPRVGLLLSNVISPPFQSSPPHHHLQLFSDFKTIYSGREPFLGLGMARAFSLTTTGVVMISMNSLPTRANSHLWLIVKGCAFKARFIAFIASILAGQSRSKICAVRYPHCMGSRTRRQAHLCFASNNTAVLFILHKDCSWSLHVITQAFCKFFICAWAP